MVFICPTKQESEDKSKILADLRQALNNVEKSLSIDVKPLYVPCCVPICDIPIAKETPSVNIKSFSPPDVMVCYKTGPAVGKFDDNPVHEEEIYRVKQSKSRELRASILYTGCLCEKRDGLQDNCPRTGCHGSPECLTMPPTCGPSEFCDAKHLGKKTHSALKKQNKVKADNGNGDQGMVQYKCFPAVVQAPVCCAVSI